MHAVPVNIYEQRKTTRFLETLTNGSGMPSKMGPKGQGCFLMTVLYCFANAKHWMTQLLSTFCINERLQYTTRLLKSKQILPVGKVIRL